MSKRELDQLLSEHRFFVGMSPDVAQIVSGCGQNQVFSAGQFLGKEGQAADDFYLIRSGRVALEIFVPGKEPLVLETLEQGDVLGWSWLIEPYQWMFDARAVEPVRAIALDGKCLRGKLDANPALANELYSRFIGVLAGRLTGARLRLIDMFAQPSQSPAPGPASDG